MFEQLQLDRRLRMGLEGLGLATATQVQREAIPAALAGADLLVSAETGSGKTLAYLLPLAQSLLAVPAGSDSGTLALVLVPTRELARQVLRQCRQLVVKSPLRTLAITGGADFRYQAAQLRKDPEILVATPGRLLEHCERGSADLSQLRILVLDEADRMLDLGFRDEVFRLAQLCPDRRQVIMLSATLGHRGVAAIAGSLLREPRSIEVGNKRQPHSSITHQRILADSPAHKDELLSALLQQGDYRRVLVFANKRSTAARLAGLLAGRGLRADSLHGELSTEERKRVLARFRDGRVNVLCASDVAARGLDVADIDLVVNYELPHSGDDYLHRTGRTGRAGASGLAVSLVGSAQWNLMISIQRYLGLTFEPRSLPGLKARYSGPKKQKSSGKAAGPRKAGPRKAGPRKDGSGRDKPRKAAAKKRGKSGKPGTGAPAGDSNDGFAPLMKKKPTR